MADRVAARPFVDRPVGPASVTDPIAEEAARAFGLATPIELRRGMNALYACDGIVLRVGDTTAPGTRAHELAARLGERGVPVVDGIDGLAGRFGPLTVTAWRRVEPAPRPTDWEAVGDAIRRLHDSDASLVPTGYPCPSPATFPWWHFHDLVAELGAHIDELALSGLTAAIERHAGWIDRLTEGAVVCHGDVHPGNVLMTDTGPLVIDWDLLCTAPRGWDHAMLTTYAERWGGDTSVYPAFAAGYGMDLRDDSFTIAVGQLRNVAATLMRVRAGLTQPAAAAEAERRLRYWRGDPDAPVWRAQ
ncbi:MAG: aminoglycoside phosphotransferase family protein [Ilumatobacter sp.]|uniref:phosphotransferase enzyme family protein n=1 Tax=Ilumatobacter sp. TaxID=1967498 RepID=UPI00262ECFC2|nr:aminoglycoside phosphotransferase family protein [Ilumatobacter sp.]MDJ0769445.1 aminoglycoside phosphotransferase family protein [Ilumatobacter sp.]